MGSIEKEKDVLNFENLFFIFIFFGSLIIRNPEKL